MGRRIWVGRESKAMWEGRHNVLSIRQDMMRGGWVTGRQPDMTNSSVCFNAESVRGWSSNENYATNNTHHYNMHNLIWTLFGDKFSTMELLWQIGIGCVNKIIRFIRLGLPRAGSGSRGRICHPQSGDHWFRYCILASLISPLSPCKRIFPS